MNHLEYPKGLKPLDIFISSIQKERQTDDLEGMSGSIDYGSVYSNRNIELYFLLRPNDTKDYRLLRDSFYDLLDRASYVVESYQQGKRYNIKIDESYVPERLQGNQTWAEANINCTSVKLPYAESIGTTQDIDTYGIDTQPESWGFGMGLIDEDTLSYTQTITKGETIDIYNAGNVDVHPFEQELAITISGIMSSNKYFALTNMTNGSEFRATEGIKGGNVITIGRGTVKNNGSHFLRSTTKDFIILSQGNNRFKIDGATSANVRFDFRFYYK